MRFESSRRDVDVPVGRPEAVGGAGQGLCLDASRDIDAGQVTWGVCEPKPGRSAGAGPLLSDATEQRRVSLAGWGLTLAGGVGVWAAILGALI
jgi:hypothetical protein